ncbi:MAG: hypothetical protein PHQ12_02840 [Chthoniobacteraceae bacterium]|nr:hypothetical protein [Chthoniobacteraceae bacterium]
MNRNFWTLLVALAAMALYLPSLGYDFVYDSVMQVHYDAYIHEPRHFADVLSLRVLGEDVLDANRPANLFSLMTDALLFGKNPAGFRLTNLLLHGAAAALLLRWLLFFTGGRLWPAVLGALVFAVHPIHTETVVEVGYREDLLATCFLLLGLNAAAAFRPGEKGRAWGPALLTVGSFFLAAASKESGAAGPVALAAYWLLFRRGKGENARAWAGLVGAATAGVALFFALRFALEVKPSLVFKNPPTAIAAQGIDWLLVQTRIWSAEFLRLLWPAHLCADYGPFNLQSIDATWALLAILTLGAAQAAGAFWSRKIALASVLFWAALLPASNLVPIYRPMADRYLYLPMTGVALLVATALAGLTRRPARLAAGMAVGAAAILLAAAALRQERLWRDGGTLWAAVARENPLSLNGWIGQGDAALDGNDPARALPFYQHASVLAREHSAEAFVGVALAEAARGRQPEAAKALSRATKLDSRYAKPETLVRAVALPAYQAQTLTLIGLRARHP